VFDVHLVPGKSELPVLIADFVCHVAADLDELILQCNFPVGGDLGHLFK
jgi:hypothetical protein